MEIFINKDLTNQNGSDFKEGISQIIVPWSDIANKHYPVILSVHNLFTDNRNTSCDYLVSKTCVSIQPFYVTKNYGFEGDYSVMWNKFLSENVFLFSLRSGFTSPKEFFKYYDNDFAHTRYWACLNFKTYRYNTGRKVYYVGGNCKYRMRKVEFRDIVFN